MIPSPIKLILSKRLFTALVLFVSFATQSQTVSSDSALQNAINNAAPGAVITVANGSYSDFEISIAKVATANSPITIKAESIGGVTLTGSSNFRFKKAAHIILQGFVFDCLNAGSLVKLEGSNNIRITRNVFEQETNESAKYVFIGGVFDDYNFEFLSHHNRIDHNIFQNKMTPGHYITVDGTSNQDESIRMQSQNDRIDHNYFRTNQPRVSNEKESIRVGWSEMSLSSGYTVVEFNLFEDCDGDPEIVSIKSSDNIVRHNTFLKSYGTLSLRHGNRNRIEGNYFFGGNKPNGTFGTSTLYTGGIRIYGTDHVIINNYFEGLEGTRWDAPITLTQGDAIDGNSNNLSKHFRAERVTIAYNTLVNNTYGIEIGFDNNNNYNTRLKDITISNNIVVGATNNLVNYIEGNDQGSEITWINNIMHPTGTASLTSDGSTFLDSEVLVANPNLDFDGTVWKSTQTTQSYANGVPTTPVDQDIHGQHRPAISNCGSDHFSTENETYGPLTPEDVGPLAQDDSDMPIDVLFLSTVSDFPAASDTQNVTINANIDWTITDDSDWITVTPASGSGNGEIAITASNNTTLDTRTGSVTVSGGALTRVLNIKQLGLNAPDGSSEIIPVSVTASESQDPNLPGSTTDKDFDTRWSALSVGGVNGDGQSITYDLGDTYHISLVKIAFHKGTRRLTFFDLKTSLNGSNFTTVLNDQTSGGASNGLENFLFSGQARYVQIVGFGNSDSEWTSLTEVEIYGSQSLSSHSNVFSNSVSIYPVPTKNSLTIAYKKNSLSAAKIYAIDGRLIMNKTIKDNGAFETSIDVSLLTKGAYIIKLYNNQNLSTSKIIIKKD